MNRSMKQMLSALLAVAMVAALLVVPSVAADKMEDGIYKLSADTTPVTVKVGETKEIAVKAEYAVSADTYAVVADTDVTATADTAVATAAVAAGKLTITGVAAGTTNVVVTVKGTTLQATIPVTVETAAPVGPTTGTFTLDAAEVFAATADNAAWRSPTAQSNNAKRFNITQNATLNVADFFTVYAKTDDSGSTPGYMENDAQKFDDGYEATYAFCFGDKAKFMNDATKPNAVIKFTTGAKATVKVWWRGGGSSSRTVAIVAPDATVTDTDSLGSKTVQEGTDCTDAAVLHVDTFELAEAGTYYVGNVRNGNRIHKVEVTIGDAPVALTGKYVFDATKIVAAGNAPATNDLVKAATTVTTTDATPVDGMFTVDGEVTVKATADGAVMGVELKKNEAGKIVFTIPAGNTATVTVGAMSTSGSNESAYAMKKDGAVVANDGELVSVVKGSTPTEIVYTDLGAGTYEIVSPADAERSRGTRIASVEVNFGGAGEDPKPPVDPDPEEPTVYTVTADTKVTVTVDSKKTVNVTVDPAGEIYAVSADTSIATVTVANGKVTITGVKAGKTTVTVGVVDGIGSAEIAVTVNAKSSGGGSSSNRPSNRPGTDEPATSTLPFTDVKVEDWFYDSVKKAFEKGLMKGTNETTFDPTGTTTRAMVATVLFRMDGEKKTDVAGLFNDVEADSWYTDAVAWAAEKGIVLGYDETTFAPNDNVTREQLVVMLYRYAAVTEKSEKDLSAFADAASVSEWATEAMTWAVEKGIILGKGNSTLDPQGVASRAEVCTMLVRFLEMK